MLAHGLGVQAIHANAPQQVKVGPAEVLFSAVPLIDTPDYFEAAKTATRDLNARFLDPMHTGKYTDRYLETAGTDAPTFADADMQAIGPPLDFVGVNICLVKSYVTPSSEAPGYQVVRMSASHPKMLSSWHTFSPEVMYWGPRLVDAIWRPKEIYITENGCAATDTLSDDGNVYDEDRVMYLRNVMAQLQRATAEGVSVKGNFVWSAFDNLEWTDGFGTRFGMIYVDFDTQQRIPKLSAAWSREASRRNALV